MIRDMAEPTMSIADVDAMLTGEGGFFETVPVIVNGVEVTTAKNRHRTCAPCSRTPPITAATAAPATTCSTTGPRRPLPRTSPPRHRSQGLAERYGIGHGDRAAILAANTPEWIQSFWAITSLGAIAVAMNGWWTEDESDTASSSPRQAAARRRQTGRTHHRRPGVRSSYSKRTSPNFAITHQEPNCPTPRSTRTTRPRSCSPPAPPGAEGRHHHPPELQRLLDVRVHPRRPRRVPLPGRSRRPAETPDAVAGRQPPFHISGLHSCCVTAVASGMGHVWTTGRFDPERSCNSPRRTRSPVSAVSPPRSGGSSNTRSSTSTTRRA